MSSEKATEFSRELNEFLAFRDDEDRIEFQAELLHLELMDQIQELMNIRGWNKADLAKYLGTSKSYITQLFTADKLLNLKTIVKLRKLFDCRLSFSFVFEDLDELTDFPLKSCWSNGPVQSTPNEDWQSNMQEYHELKIIRLKDKIGAA